MSASHVHPIDDDYFVESVPKYKKTSKKRREIIKEEKIVNTSRQLLSMCDIQPKTINQKRVFESYNYGNNMILSGTAGTGKTFLSMYLALRDVLNNEYDKIFIIRSATPTKDIGFLPGKLQEKIEAYEVPYANICQELFNRKTAYDHLKRSDKIEFLPTSYLRGTTINNGIVIVDEIQNCKFSEFHTVATRIGDNCKVLLCGDIKQTDLDKRDFSDVQKIFDTLKKMSNIDHIEFTINDIVRSDFVREWILACEHS